jgi:shikimate kinase
VSPRAEHPEVHRNLALIGGRGCGKSSIAKRLARTNRNFMLFSLDALIRYEAGGASIPEIVEREDWPGFREREHAAVQKVAAFESGALIDCGGGVVVDLDDAGEEVFSRRKVDALRRRSLVVYLRRETGYLIDRISSDTNRPSLSETSSFREIMERRDPWYQEAADWVLECGAESKTELTERILSWFYDTQGGASEI